MNWKRTFEHLEEQLRALFEKRWMSAFELNLLLGGLRTQLEQALQDAMHPSGEVPKTLLVSLNPQLAQVLIADAYLLEKMGHMLQEMAQEMGYPCPTGFVVKVLPDETLHPGEVLIKSHATEFDGSFTSTVDVQVPANEKIPQGAYLIVDGTHVFPLERSVVNIGRRLDNQLVIEDARVSRVHAQLRAVNGEYVVFDLDSKGGTWVNGERISQKRLAPGDVISLAGVPLVYGREPGDGEETQELKIEI